MKEIFETLESEVRGYCRSFPTVFARAHGHTLVNKEGEEFIDLFAGAGALNYGHNHPCMQDALVEYIRSQGVTHSLDMMTEAKARFLARFEEVILKPRNMDYKTMFPGPTGTNAVEAALKLARKVTGRTNIISFTNGFHGMTLGSLSVTGNAMKRNGAGVPLNNTMAMPFCAYRDDTDTLNLLETYLQDSSSGVELPAAFILETIQAEGGVNVASESWLKGLQEIAQRHGILLILDDIQVGCGRTGPFFSFDGMGLDPDIICLSKSLSGYGVPFAITLMKPEHDVWTPGEHNGTFRGHNLAFITATVALGFWENDTFQQETTRKAQLIEHRLKRILADHPEYEGEWRGRGMIQAIAFQDASRAGKISRAAYDRKVIIETAGTNDQVLKLLPPLVISDEAIAKALDVLEDSMDEVFADVSEPVEAMSMAAK